MTGKALAPALRKQLEKAVRAARSEGEAGAHAALRALAVDAARPHESMSADERSLRRRLRAHGRQLGDRRDRQSGTQEIGLLAHEVAWEHWHRMLFARFLAENGLLVEPESGVAVTLQECAELAREMPGSDHVPVSERKGIAKGDRAGRLGRCSVVLVEEGSRGLAREESGAEDGWQVAERFAARMLPRIFRPGDPSLAVTLAPEMRQVLEKLVGELPDAVFTASDSLGWTYQFWQADRKDEVNRSGAKIGAGELPAVTQLFTEHYMVRFLFHNTVGAWRAGKMLAERPELALGATSEAELAAAMRIKAAGGLDGYDFDYLRFVRAPERRCRDTWILEDGAAEDAAAEAPAAIRVEVRRGDDRAGAEESAAEGSEEDAAAEAPAVMRVEVRRGDAGAGAEEDAEGMTKAASSRRRTSSRSSGRSSSLPPAGPWRPAAGAFRRWPRRAAELRVLDPCCGSGHFLVEGLELLVRLRMEEGGLDVEAAVRAVLKENLHGLEIDPRCAQIAAFNLAFSAWKMVGRPVPLPPLQIACSGVAPNAAKDEWLDLAKGRQGVKAALDRLHVLFAQAPVLGSLIDAAGLGKGLFQADYEEAEHALDRALARDGAEEAERVLDRAVAGEDSGAEEAERALGCALAREDAVAEEAERALGYALAREDAVAEEAEHVLDRALSGEDVAVKEAEHALDRALAREDVAGDEERERAVAAQGISRAAKLLSGEYDLVITNVPYLARGKQGATLRAFASGSHPDAKADLATLFVSRGLRWLGRGGAQAVVAPQNWLSLTSYRKLRERLLRKRTWRLVARLGPGAFETIGGHVVNVAMAVLSAETPDKDWCMTGIDVSAPRGRKPIPAQEKAKLLRTGGQIVLQLPQDQQRRNPDSVIRLLDYGTAAQSLLSQHALGLAGILNGDSLRFRRMVWEFHPVPSEWVMQQTSVDSVERPDFFGGHSGVIYFDEENGHLREDALVRRTRLHDSDRRGNAAWGRTGVGISQMATLPATLYSGAKFDSNVAVILPKDQALGSAIWCYCSAPEYAQAVREIDQKLNVTNATLVKVPFDLERWTAVARRKYPNGLPEPHSDDPTQWLFHGHPCGSVVWDQKTKWTAHGPLRVDGSVLHVAVARLLGYRWSAELDPEMRLAAESREWVRRSRELDGHADEDGIVCLQAAAGELPAADRLRALLAASYGQEWSAAKEQELLSAAAGGKRPSRSLDEWLRDRFFAEHCKRFHNRPFIWHVWDGRKDGFHALVNCHRLCGPDGQGRRTLQALAYRHLGEWIDRQRTAQSRGEAGADARLAAAQDLQDQLELILEGEPPYDLFVRWRPLHEQPLGWAPNLDDGVRLNIRPFMRAELQAGGRKGAGILRARPNIRWGKDRGKEPRNLRPRQDFPWFWSCPAKGAQADCTDYKAPPEAVYDGARWNDLHYSRAVKSRAIKSRAIKEAARKEEARPPGCRAVGLHEGGEVHGVE